VVNGKKQGPAKEFYRNGVLNNEGTFKDDWRNGIFKIYGEDGVLKAMDFYEYDRLLRHQEFNRDGKLVTEQIYYTPS
jgi:antitoxin component YwqK of YwqJK toxin-antitoxin module